MRKIPILILMFIIIFAIASCTSNNSKQQPVYEGMSIIKSSDISANGESSNTFSLSSIPIGDNNGEIIDDEESLDKDIQDLVDIEVITDENIKYYVSREEIFIVRIHLSNPNDYEIQSFTLNGKKYANYMFKEGSTMELLLLEVTAPSISGYIEYTIDAIKYIDGTEIKDVRMDGSQTIKAGIQYDYEPSITNLVETAYTTSLNITFDFNDQDGITYENEVSIYLSDGETIIEKKDIIPGSNNITFSNLEMAKTYEYGIVAVYDLVDGSDIQINWLAINIISTTKAYTFINFDATQTSITFDLQKFGAEGTFKYFNLINESTNEILYKIDDTTIREITDLLSNHTYIVEGVFEYTLNQKIIEDSIKLKITTEAKTSPVVEIIDFTSTQTTISFALQITDIDDIYSIEKVELYQGETLKKNLGDLSEGSFTELLSNNQYMIKVTYIYDLNDGEGRHSETATTIITTEAKTAPVVSISNQHVSDSLIKADLVVSDPDLVSTISKIELYENNQWIANNPNLEIFFDDLVSYTDYTIRITHTYNLNDGNGISSQTVEFDLKTAPYFKFSDIKVLNTTAVSEGDTIILQANIDNPSNASYSKVVVNGIEYNVSSASTQNRLRVEIVNSGQFSGGSTILNIEEINASIGGMTFQIEIPNDSFATVFINGNIELLSVEFVDENFETLGNHIFPNQIAYLKINLSNPTEYDISSIIVDGVGIPNLESPLYKIDSNTYYKILTLQNGTNIPRVTSISYSNAYLSKEMVVNSNNDDIIFKVISDVTIEITNANDLLNMDDGNYYELSNDIDLSGINWLGNNFYGVFNGNGYSIKNMSNVSSYQNQDVYLGLFKYGDGIIENLCLEEITVIVDLFSSSDTRYSLIYGGIIAQSLTRIIMQNVSVDEYSSLSITNKTLGTTYAGGLIGYSNFSTIIDCYNKGMISSKGHIGGFIGSSNASNIIINSYNSGMISGEWFVGGFIGSLYSTSIITNSFNSGTISGKGYVGGFIGASSSGTTTISNSYNSGIISGDGYIGGFLGRSYPPIIISNSYNSGVISGEYLVGSFIGTTSYITSTINNSYCITILNEFDSLVVATNQLDTLDFYLNVLEWDPEIWNFEDLDRDSNKYPTLR